MNCLCLTTNKDRPSTRYRLLQYIPYLSKEAIDVQVEVLSKGIKKWRIFARAGDYDGLFIQKKLLSRIELKYLRSQARHLIYDFDDAVMYGSHLSGISRKTRRYKRFQYVVSNADLIIAGNGYLASQIEEVHSRKVVIVPTVIKISEYPIKDYTKINDRVTIGWIGTKSTLGYLKMVEPLLERLAQRYPQLQVKVVSDGKLDIQRSYIDYSRWEQDKEVEELLSFDIGVMPLPKDSWTEGKCGFKLIQYMAVGIPVVCSPVGMNREIVTHGVNGFLAESSESWEEYLNLLIENMGLRKQMGLAGRDFVEKNYNLNYWGPYMARLLKGKLRIEK